MNTVARTTSDLVSASRANLQTSMNLATRSIEDAAELVRRQLQIAMTISGEETAGSNSAPGAAAVPARDHAAEFHACRERQLHNILDLSCQCLEVTAKAQTELVRLIHDNFQCLDEAMRFGLNAPAGTHGTPRALRRV